MVVKKKKKKSWKCQPCCAQLRNSLGVSCPRPWDMGVSFYSKGDRKAYRWGDYSGLGFSTTPTWTPGCLSWGSGCRGSFHEQSKNFVGWQKRSSALEEGGLWRRDEERQSVLSSATRGRHLRHHEDSFWFCPLAEGQTLSAVMRHWVCSHLLKQLWEINPTLEQWREAL